ncbi:MAG: DUF1592 domain-containing protein [Planctomycetales bacterium]|nr:DUF1592 domain-containing protein [Planctomycetales bacterium]
MARLTRASQLDATCMMAAPKILSERAFLNEGALPQTPRPNLYAFSAPGASLASCLRSFVLWCLLFTLDYGFVILAQDAPSFADSHTASKVIAQHCRDCHNAATREGDLNLDEFQWRFDSEADRQIWSRIHDRVLESEMPPADSGITLSAEQRTALLDPLAESLYSADREYVRQHGRGPARRLNRIEFENNLRDLLLLPHLDVRDFLPEDRQAHQSNKSAASLDLTRVQLAAYLDATEHALRQAVASGLQPRQSLHYRALATNMFPKAVDHAGRESSFYAKHSQMLPLTDRDLQRIRRENTHDPQVEVAIFRSAAWPYYGYPENFLAVDDGLYQVRFQARAVRQLRDFRLSPSPTPQPMTFRARQPSKADVSGDVRAVGGIMDIQAESQVFETTIYLKRGETFEYSLLGLPVPHPITSHGGPLYYDFPPMPDGGHSGVAFQWLEVTGPVDPSVWPPPSHQVLFADLPIQAAAEGRRGIDVVTEVPERDAIRLLRAFARRAARTPMTDQALEPYVELVHEELRAGSPFTEAILAGYRAFLCSPHFLYLPEPQSSADQYAVAARLSHFLWNSPPDKQLSALAATGSLNSPKTLRQEAERLMQHERFESFVANFANYWLDLRHVQRDSPDIRLYPEYRGDDYLIESMERETLSFVLELFRENLPVTNLVQADFVMINDRLARHYELPPVTGSAIRRVPVPAASLRGGLLTQAAILKVTANGTTTSPVKRGAWVMDRVMGAAPPPPPADVPAIEPDIRGASTVRELLAKHAESELCASCHAKFDPVGMALENFDILGGYRSRYRSLERGDEITGIDRAGHKFSYHVASEIDARGNFIDGRTFENISELKHILASEERQLARNLLERLVVFATGTPLRFSDRPEVDVLLDRCAADGYRAGDLLLNLVNSRIFLSNVRWEPADASE